MPRAIPSFRLPALSPSHPPDALAPEDARLTDRHRLAVVLEAAALLAHLHRSGRRLTHGLDAARVTPAGRLAAGPAVPGRPRSLPQAQVRGLLLRLFRSVDEPPGSDDTHGAARGRIAGRGEARRAARALVALWRQELVDTGPDRLVGQVFDAAPFLWAEPFADVRRTLVCPREDGGGFRVAGPPVWRREIRRRVETWERAADLVGSHAARELWRLEPPCRVGEGEGAAAAWSCFEAGRFATALDVLDELESPDASADALRLRCLYHLGRHGAARRTLARVWRRAAKDEGGAAATRLATADVAVRLHAATGDRRGVRRWRDRALAAAEDAARADRLSAELVAASASWDLGDDEALDRHLAAAHDLSEEPARPTWRWLQIAALRDHGRGDGVGAVRHLEAALAGHRRSVARHEAAGLWNDLGVARAAAGSLAGAERAFRHAVRLFEGCDGPRRNTLALQNLAEVRLRRGDLRGVPDLLERARRANREADNFRGAVCDAALEARHELTRGRPDAALAVCRRALRDLDARGGDFHRGPLSLLALRALGWRAALAGHGPPAAADLIPAVTPADLSELEPEERPALWVLLGRSDEAAASARALPAPLAATWEALLAGASPAVSSWEAALASLELSPDGFRAARLALDAELVSPGSVPGTIRRRAAARWRALGADTPRRRLEAADAEPWEALVGLAESTETGEIDPERWFTAAGFGHVRLDWEPARGVAGGPRILVDGRGGPEELRGACAGGAGELVLRAERLSPPLRGLFAVARAVHRPPPVAPEVPRSSVDIVGESPVLRHALDRLGRFAASELPVLVTGESGTGKELAARFVHRHSPRREGPFVPVNSAALSETLILSDLFGHARGAFTGADKERAGVFETAQGGTVFLDEIGDLPAPAQGMLLRVLQEGEVRRLGESTARRVDVRVVAATHRDLEALARQGSFRRDLLFRLRGAAVCLPPLRDRGDDVGLLAEHHLRRATPPGEVPPRLTPAARAALAAHRWPGNVRELGHALDAARALAAGPVIDAPHLELSPAAADDEVGDYHGRVEAYRRRLVEDALEAADGRQAEAARRLGLTRQALSYLVRKLGIPPVVR